MARITGTLHEDRCTFMIVSRLILLRMRNGSDKSCRENKKTHFVFSNFSPKIVPFMRKCGKSVVQSLRHMKIMVLRREVSIYLPDN
jgi:hypothetical protein